MPQAVFLCYRMLVTRHTTFCIDFRCDVVNILVITYLDSKLEDESIVLGKVAGLFWVHPAAAV
jgi:hypothetical protein